MGGAEDKPIPAASVLLLRDEPAFQVLMVERHAAIGFAGGAMVFPGGRIDPGDHNPSWKENAVGFDTAVLPAQVAAIREAFEEAGILLARRRGTEQIVDGETAAALDPWRSEIEADDSRFFDLIAGEKLELACDTLCLFAHWIAPPGLHKRFDTIFFAARCPPEQEAREDGNEATETLWTSPENVIAERERGERTIIFPTLCNLHLLGASRSTAEVFASARVRKIAPVTPNLTDREGAKWLTIPNGLGYPFTEERLDRSFSD